jgi:hypothetical protein
MPSQQINMRLPDAGLWARFTAACPARNIGATVAALLRLYLSWTQAERDALLEARDAGDSVRRQVTGRARQAYYDAEP